MKDALIVFAKIPEPGRVKTRLTPFLSPEDAARLYEAFLLDALDQYRRLPADVRLYIDAPADQIPESMRKDGISIRSQSGKGLGRRMAHAFVETFMEGYERAVIVGTDHPTLPAVYIEQAFRLLDEPYSVSIGPSEDGGYYLLGMNEFYPELFQDMTYSHPRVFEKTIQRIAGINASLGVLPIWYDVDEPDTLRRLIADLVTSEAPLMHTRSRIGELKERYPL